MTDQPLSWSPQGPSGSEGPAAEPAVTRSGAQRLAMIDMLRGFVIVFMVLDHVREYFHIQAFAFDATDLSQTHPVLFATRWITHLCAPTFVFLSGVSAFMQRENGADRGKVSRFLLTRGLWLIALEVTLISFGFNFAHPFLFLQVIFAIGVGMVLLSGLVWLSPYVVLALGAAIVGGHALLGGVQADQFGALAPLWRLAMQPGPIPGLPSLIIYPVVPWFGVMCLGYGLGRIFVLPDDRRRMALGLLAMAALIGFAVLRTLNGYGDPVPWKPQKDQLFTAMSFINVSKYPPSLDYVLVTLGVSLLIGLWLERLRGFTESLLLAFGRTPLFTYLIHIYLIHTLAMGVGYLRGFPPASFTHFLDGDGALAKAHWGYGLPVVYVIWLLVVLLLYPMARAYARAKQDHRQPWMSYL